MPVRTSLLGLTSSTYRALTSLKRVAKMSRFLAISKYRSAGGVNERSARMAETLKKVMIILFIAEGYRPETKTKGFRFSWKITGKYKVKSLCVWKNQFIPYADAEHWQCQPPICRCNYKLHPPMSCILLHSGCALHGHGTR